MATDVCLTADPESVSLIPAQLRTFVEIDHEIISSVILLPSTELFKKSCQIQTKECARSTGYYRLFKFAQEKVWLSEI